MSEFFNALWAFMASHPAELAEQVGEHLYLTLVAMVLATVVGVTTGIGLSRSPRLEKPVMGLVNVIQVIPSLALLGFLLPVVGIGEAPAIIALFLYALLPMVRGTHTGIREVDASVVEAARGMGMRPWQVLWRVELPLALPVIFSGIRTAAVINVGIATICALVAAGGLGEFIFRGIALNNVYMIVAGALPAALLALLLDALLGLVERYLALLARPLLVAGILLVLGLPAWVLWQRQGPQPLVGGFPYEFIERGDGYRGLQQHYGLRGLALREMEIGLMYDAIKEGHVDVISGFSTDARIKAYDLAILADDKQYFPPYHAAPLLRGETLERYPELGPLFDTLRNKIADSTMVRLNYAVEVLEQNPKDVARGFLESLGIAVRENTGSRADVVVGSKNFTESFVLAHLFAQLIESHTPLNVELKLSFGGTKLLFDALALGEVDMYPEYTGTGYLVILGNEGESTGVAPELQDKDRLYDYVNRRFVAEHNVHWLPPLGFNNTFALMMRREQAEELGLGNISELKHYLDADNAQ